MSFYCFLFIAFSNYFVHLSLNRTNFDYLQEVPILTLDVNEDFKDKYDSLVEKVDLYKDYKVTFVLSKRSILTCEKKVFSQKILQKVRLRDS